MPPRTVPVHQEPDEEEKVTQQTSVPEYEVVQPGESFQQFAARVGVHPDRIRQLNELQLAEDARSRGFDAHTFMRRTPNEDGSVSERPDCHVFGGQRLRLRLADEED